MHHHHPRSRSLISDPLLSLLLLPASASTDGATSSLSTPPMGGGASVPSEAIEKELFFSLGLVQYLATCTGTAAAIREACVTVLASMGDTTKLLDGDLEKKLEKVAQLHELFKVHRSGIDPSIWQPVEPADPWRSITEEQQLDRLREEEGTTLACDSIEEDTPAATQVLELMRNARPSVQHAGYRVVIEACDLTEWSWEARALRETVTSLNLSTNNLETLSLLLPTNLRQLTLSSNPLTALPILWGCPHLLSLDLSYITTLAPLLRPSTFALVHHLRQLKLQGCGLQSLTALPSDGDIASSIFKACSHLCDLGLAENEIDNIDVLQTGLNPLTKCLKELDLKDNPVAAVPTYRSSLLSLLPSLLVLDNQGTGIVMQQPLFSIPRLRDQVERNVTLLDENTASEVDAALRGKKDLTIIS